MIVENGTGVIGANSYSTVVFADDYFSLRGITEWDSLTNKEALLVQATDYIENVYSQNWNGLPLTDTQGLSMPIVNGVEFIENLKKVIETSHDRIDTPGDITKIKPGVKIRHQRFGSGIIESIEGSGNNLKASVAFDNGQKKQLLLKFAKLEVVV